VFRPTGFADLAGRRVGIFGYGVEGRATRRRLRGVTDTIVLVDDDDVDGPGAHEHVGDFQRLLARIGLRDQQVVDLDAELFRINRVERVFRVDERRGSAVALRRGDDRERERRLARGLRPEDLDDAPARNSADTERDVEAQGARRNRIHFIGRARIAQAHHGAFSKLLFNLAQRGSESLLSILFHGHSSTVCGAIISYPAPCARLICNGITEFSTTLRLHPVVARCRLLYRPAASRRPTIASDRNPAHTRRTVTLESTQALA